MNKKYLVVFLIIISLLTTVSCGKKKVEEVQPAAPVEVVKTQQVVETKPAEPVKAPEPEVTPVPVNETVVVKEEVAEAPAPLFEPYVYNFSYGNMTAQGVFDEESAVITFSENSDLSAHKNIIDQLIASHPELLSAGITYSVDKNVITLTYPKGSTQADLEYLINLVSQEVKKAEEAARIAAEKAAAEAEAARIAAEKAAAEKAAAEEAARIAAEKAAAEAKAALEAAERRAAEEAAAEAEAARIAAEEAEKNRIFGTSSYKLFVNPINLNAEYKNIDYSFGAEAQYEFRLCDTFGVAAAGVFNEYFDKDNSKNNLTDVAIVADLLAYGPFSENVFYYAGIGAGVNLFIKDSKLDVNPLVRVLTGVEVQLTDHFALNYGVGVQVSCDNSDSKTTFQPARLGASFYF